MNENGDFKIEPEQPDEWEALDPAMKEALGDFKGNVHAWSEAMMNRPRAAHKAVVRRTWMLAASGALASVLIAGAVSGGFYEHYHRQEVARIAAAQEAAHQRELAAERARVEEEDLLAKVDSDVSQEVPSALEPLASLTNDDDTTK
jgi:hypothetical protein